MNKSKLSRTSNKNCKDYVLKLNHQIQTIASEVDYFNARQNVIHSNHNKSALKRLTQPKFQKIIIQKQDNPENSKIGMFSKTSKILQNSSTLSHSNFYGKNPSLLMGATSSVVFSRSENVHNQIQRKLSKKLKTLQKVWTDVETFRQMNEINDKSCSLHQTKRMKDILSRIEKKRPSTSSSVRGKVPFFGSQFIEK